MDILQRPALKAAGAESAWGQEPKKLILIHTGAVLLVSVILAVLDYLLEQGIGATGGLSGISLRSALSTVQTLLRYVQAFALPAWTCGYLAACLRLSRGEPADTSTLLAGFHRFGSVLRYSVLQGLIYTVLAIVCIYISSAIFLATPWSQPLMEIMEPVLTTGEIPEELFSSGLETAILPLLLIFCGLFLAVCLPIGYMLKFGQYALMDTEKIRARAAIRESARITKGHRWALLKLDLSFWWFYALEVLVGLLCYGDLLLAAAGVQLPWSEGVSYFLFLGLYALAEMGLYYWKKNAVSLTYAHAYGVLKAAGQERHQLSEG